ncbi:hypothetical protein NKJ36_07520 [Mesorhizobium sp. M0142]|uniref:hypothetical protein n=1 Tax=Mesorhizobium sp. M0142 TaxID=2956894 RepID=UPI00333C3ABF
MDAARRGLAGSACLDERLGPSQAGATLRLIQQAAVVVVGEAARSTEIMAPSIQAHFAPGTAASRLIGAPVPDLSTLEKTAAAWFTANPSPNDAAAGGYWLADMFLRGTIPTEVADLTRFLMGGTAIPPPSGRLPSVRRYPTGGVSEKQALILPALLRATSEKIGWCSPFLVAKRLAHTGGTIDKLGILPGFAPASSTELDGWMGRPVPVLYVTAGSALCPRDAAMYRMRGETGTVSDHGLMAASILSKQVAAPVDGLVLDILHGPTAFLKDNEEAQVFGQLCIAVSHEFGISLTPSYRQALSPLGRAIGANTEVLEVAEMLRGGGNENDHAEIEQALVFIEMMAQAVGLDGRTALASGRDAVESGSAFRHLLDLWLDHGVEPQFLEFVADDARATILSDLQSVEIYAAESGTVHCNWVKLADTVNNRINGFRAAGDGSTKLTPGGVEVRTTDGACVQRGDIILVAYASTNDPDVVSELAQAFQIKS